MATVEYFSEKFLEIFLNHFIVLKKFKTEMRINDEMVLFRRCETNGACG